MKLALKLLLLPVLMGISACSTIDSNVTRFHQLPAHGTGQTFKILPPVKGNAAAAASGLEFASYAARVSTHLEGYGWVQASPNASTSDYTVRLTYQRGRGREVIGSVPIIGPVGGGYTYQTGFVSSYGGRHCSPYGYNAISYSTPVYGVVGAAPYSATIYDRHFEMAIADRKGKSIFEGRAMSTGGSPEIAAVLPSMIDALFTGFPGQSGRTERISKRLR